MGLNCPAQPTPNVKSTNPLKLIDKPPNCFQESKKVNLKQVWGQKETLSILPHTPVSVLPQKCFCENHTSILKVCTFQGKKDALIFEKCSMTQ